MAGFRAGISANKDKEKGKKDLDEKASFHDKLKNGNCLLIDFFLKKLFIHLLCLH